MSAPVTSLRAVAWDSFNVNFFVVGSPALARDLPGPLMVSGGLTPDQQITVEPGYQVPFGSRDMPIARGWGTGGLQLTLSLIGPDDILKVIDQGADLTAFPGEEQVTCLLCKIGKLFHRRHYPLVPGTPPPVGALWTTPRKHCYHSRTTSRIRLEA